MSEQPVQDRAGLRLRVRMFRQGLGDCFLLSFFRNETVHHVLIDCGVLQGTPEGEERMRMVARNIRRLTKRRLDLVVATHEHWDHLSGFLQARDIFDQIQMREIWMAWTEDPTDSLAESLRSERSLAWQAVRSAVGLMPDEMVQIRSGIFGLLNFYGEPLGAAGLSGARQALDYLRSREDARLSFCSPGEAPRTLAGLEGVRFFVLGPPRDEKKLLKGHSSRARKEGYGLAPDAGLVKSLLDATENLQASGRMRSAGSTSLPFDERFCVPPDDARGDPFFTQYYGFDDEAGHGESWRRIENDWLRAADSLALNLDHATNNTSLVLAIELVDTGRVLLFPADAQRENWSTWGDLEWDLPASEGSMLKLRSEDLLRRTVLYKVSHHASHNATLSEHGLERMESPELCALITVSRERVEKLGWNMPFPALFERLLQKTRGRVIRLDDGIAGEPPVTVAGQPLLTRSEWKAFRANTDPKELYIDLIIE